MSLRAFWCDFRTVFWRFCFRRFSIGIVFEGFLVVSEVLRMFYGILGWFLAVFSRTF